MRLLKLAVCSISFALAVFAQSDRGTITGTVSDPAGAVVANAPIDIRNVETGIVNRAASSATGNYTIAQLPAGQYELSVTVPGFKKYVRQSLTVGVAQTFRVDVLLEVGSNTESVTVTEAAPLLKTESGELSHTVSTSTMNNLPVMSIGANASASGIRTPYSVVQLLPGSNYATDSSIRINGNPTNSQAMRIDGQDATNGWYSAQSQTQSSVDSIQEFAIQTSNYSAEFGLAGGGVFNLTMKSGTNQLHGTVYDYFVNEFLNAGVPFTSDGNGHLLRPRQRRNDFGFTAGGPVYIPKLFDGRNKAFFFFGYEQYRETTVNNATSTTLPTLDYRAGNFAAARTGRVVTTDGLGRQVLENTVYDPQTDRVEADGLRYRNIFPGNIVPLTRMDPVAQRVQALIPLPTTTGLINNYIRTFVNPKSTTIPSLKADYQLMANAKLSGFWSTNHQDNPNVNILPDPIRGGLPSLIRSTTVRLNYDQTLTPTLLLHFGAGVLGMHNWQPHLRYDPVALIGLRGTNNNLFPVFGGMSNAQGGMAAGMGPGQDINLNYYKPTGNASLTWVRNNHTLKFGGEVMVNGYLNRNGTYANGYLTFTAIETGLPALNGQSLAAQPGFNYASFFLGGVNNGQTAVRSVTHMGSHTLSGFAQDTWKITRKLTLDYGLRYDFATYLRDGNGYYGVFGPNTVNPSAGGRLGAVVYDGYGGGRCNCDLAHNYPYAWGPRLGVAYQVGAKTVLRAGLGISYNKSDDNNFGFSSGSQFLYNSPSYGDPAYYMQDGLPYKIKFPNFDPGQYPLPGTTASIPQLMDRHAGRPARQVQWSVGFQREVIRNLLAEVNYVGNRGVWWNAADLNAPNSLQPSDLARYGLSATNAADRTLLAAPLFSSIAAQRGFATLPYPGYPVGSAVAQTLRPYPQFSALSNNHWVPIGNTWYDSLQAKLTKRFSHGLDFSSAFTWQKSLTSGVEDKFGRGGGVYVNDPFNRVNQKAISVYDQPFQLVFSGSYTTPGLGGDHIGKKALSWAVKDWQIGTLLRYASGTPTLVPQATTNLATYLFQSTVMNRVPGQPLFTQDLNCHCFDPNTTFVLNPKAWVNPPLGQYGVSAAYYNDYRERRRPVESMSLARTFRIQEKMSLQIRGEFTNIFNRTQLNSATSTNALATQTTNSAGQTTAGFGYINNANTTGQRQGQMVARFIF
ncbi:MAG: hypothetical protein JWO19_1015 [Bryobacterales bacterium]|nr:hypothetical protein [Bryobacterales bacterium]